MRAAVTLHPLSAADSAPARALANAVLGDTPSAPSMLAPLDGALRSETDEYRALIARDTGAVIGLIVFGEIAGAIGAGRIYCVAVDDGARRRGIASALIEAACTELRSRGARFVAIEMAQDPRLDAARAVAARAGFLAEGRVSDYVRDGVDLVLFRRDFRETNNPA